jgi:hypothetical protein
MKGWKCRVEGEENPLLREHRTFVLRVAGNEFPRSGKAQSAFFRPALRTFAAQKVQ